MTPSWLRMFDTRLITYCRTAAEPLSRLALFIVYFWFGAIKVFAVSPANPLVASLLERTMPFISFDHFIVLLGLFEMLVGVLFLVRGFERTAFGLLIVHMITTLMPLVLLPGMMWQSFLVPTLEGQYSIKNILIIALAVSIVGRLKPRPDLAGDPVTK